MPDFKGIVLQGGSGGGGGGGNMIEMMLKFREMRISEQSRKEKAELDRLAAMSKAKADVVNLAIKRAELQEKLDSLSPGISSAQRNAAAEFTPQDVSSGLVNQSGGDPFASIVQGLDPEGFQRASQAQTSLRSRIDTASSIQGALSGSERRELEASVLGSAAGSRREVARQKELDIAEAVAEAKIALLRDEATEDRATAQRRITEGLAPEVSQKKSIETQRGKQIFAGELRSENKELRKRIFAAERNGEDTSDLKAELDFNKDTIKRLRSGSAITIKTQIPPHILVKQSNKIAAGDSVIELAEALVGDLDSGDVKVGSVGFIENMKVRAVGVAANWLTDPETPEEVKELIREGLSSKNKTFKIRDVSGKQLTLGIDQFVLSWAFIKSGRDSAKFTLFEMKSINQFFNFTKPFGTEGEARESLRKVVSRVQKDRNRAMNIIEFYDVDASRFTGEFLTPADKDLQRRITGTPAAAVEIPGGGKAVERDASGRMDMTDQGPVSNEMLEVAN